MGRLWFLGIRGDRRSGRLCDRSLDVLLEGRSVVCGLCEIVSSHNLLHRLG